MGGAASVVGGAAGGGNRAGGAVTIDGGAKNGSGADGLISIGVTAGSFVKFGKKIQATATAWTIADPGNAGAIPVTASGVCALTSAGAETRSLAIPTFMGQRLSLICDTYVGNIVVTAASAVDSAAHTVMTFGAAGRVVTLVGVTVGGSRKWRLVGADGVVLS